ncbi:MAG: hypothetical protein ACOCZV_02665, partial [Nanoarchaeota archaeon]
MVKRQRLSFWVFLIAGVLISGYSMLVRLISEESNDAAMMFFFYIGVGFIVIGLLKLLFKRLSGSPIAKQEERFASKLGGVDQIDKDEATLRKEKVESLRKRREEIFPKSDSALRQSQSSQQQPRQRSQPAIIACPHCNTKNYTTS